MDESRFEKVGVIFSHCIGEDMSVPYPLQLTSDPRAVYGIAFVEDGKLVDGSNYDPDWISSHYAEYGGRAITAAVYHDRECFDVPTPITDSEIDELYAQITEGGE